MPMSPTGDYPITPDLLAGYLSETLTPTLMAAVEKALRDSADLRAQLEVIRQNRVDFGLHTLGAIWKRHRLTCPDRRLLGSFLLDALDPEYADYIAFHIQVIGCPYCSANFDDLKGKVQEPSPSILTRQSRIFRTSKGLLTGDPNT